MMTEYHFQFPPSVRSGKFFLSLNLEKVMTLDEPLLSVAGVTKRFGGVVAAGDLSFDI